MSTMIERKNYAAQCLLARGLNKTTIIAILCNGYHESAGSFSPTQGQIGGGGGFGIWQWTGNARQGEIVSYARTHSEKDAIKWQCNFLVDNRPNQWIAKAGLLWNDFLHNTPNRDWKWLTWCFCVSWERPGIPLMNSRYAAYDKIMPIDWGNGGGGGGGNVGGNTKPATTARKYPTMKQCMALYDKMHPRNNTPENPNNQKPNPGGGGAVGGFDPKPCLEYFNAHRGHLYYSMPGRAGVYSGRCADCSSFVSYMLHLGYHDNNTILYTTETLHDRLTALGYHCVEQGSVRVAHYPFKTGDVIILGRRGYSLGAGGHTGICLDAPGFFDCNYTSNGLNSYASGQAFLNWHYATNYWYHYTK